MVEKERGAICIVEILVDLQPWLLVHNFCILCLVFFCCHLESVGTLVSPHVPHLVLMIPNLVVLMIL